MSKDDAAKAVPENGDIVKYACPECGGREFVSSPDSYSVYIAEGDRLLFKRTETIEAEMNLHCRDCGEEVPVEYLESAKNS